MKNLLTIFLSLALVFMLSLTVDIKAYDSDSKQEELEELKEPEQKPKEKKEEKKEEMKEEMEQPKVVKPAHAEDELKDIKSDVPEGMRYFKESYEVDYKEKFEDVWNAAIKALDTLSCQIIKKVYKQDDNGLFKGFLTSDFCVFVMGDSTFKTVKKFSFEGKEEIYHKKKFPIIRGGRWMNGRMQYKFVLNEKENGTVHLLLKGELSGFEDYVTNLVQFWDSNGILESRILEAIKKNLSSPK